MKLSSHPDVIIVGAGPAGSSTAIRLARRGIRVLLLEQKQFPRHKLCGEFISPECIAHFADLGVLDAIRTDAVSIAKTTFYSTRGRSLSVPSKWFGHGDAVGLSRAEMDARLLDRARVAGVTIAQASISSALIKNGRVVGVCGRDNIGNSFEATANVTIDATGRSRILARDIEKQTNGVAPRRADYVAFKAHLRGAKVPGDECEIYGYRGGYGGCSSVENGVHNLCFIVSSKLARDYNSDADALLKNVVFTNRQAKNAMCDARAVGEWLAVPIARYGRTDLAPAEGLLAVGDAAGFIDPFTGSGILLALESGKILSDAVVAEFSVSHPSFAKTAAEYRRAYAAAFDRRLRISSIVRRAAFVPSLAEMIVKTLSLSERLTRRLAQATRPAKNTSSFPQERGPIL